MQLTTIAGNILNYSSNSVLLDEGATALTFSLGASQQLLCRSANLVVTSEERLSAMAGQLDNTAPAAVMLGSQVYAFYFVSGQCQYSVYDPANGWSIGGAIPTPYGTDSISPVVFTPADSDVQLIYLFYFNSTWQESSETELYTIGCLTTSDGGTWTSVADEITFATISQTIDGTITDIGMPSVVAYDPSSSTPQLYIFYSVNTTDSSGDPALFTCYSTYDGSSSSFGSTQVAISEQSANYSSSTTAVVAPSSQGDALIYLFYTDYGSTNIGGYEDVTGPMIFYGTFDGSIWTTGVQVQGLYAEGMGVSAGLFPPESFLETMSTSQDIYLGYPTSPNIPNPDVCNSTVLLVNSLTQFADNTAVTGGNITYDLPLTTIQGNGTLLPVQFPGTTVPQAWFFEVGSVELPSGQVLSELYYRVYGPNGWSRKLLSPAQPTCSPSAVRFQQRAFVFSNTNACQLCYTEYDGRTTHPMTMIGNAVATDSPSTVVFEDMLYVFYQGAGANANQLWYVTSSDGETWSDSLQVPGATLSESPSATVFDGMLYVFYQDQNSDGQLWYSTLSGSTWQEQNQVIPTGQSASSALIIGAPFSIPVFSASANAEQLMVFYTAPGEANSWPLACCTLTDDEWTQTALSGMMAAAPPTAAIVDGVLLLLFAAAGDDNGQLFSARFDDQSQIWTAPSKLGTTSTMAGSATCLACHLPQTAFPSYCVLHNNSGALSGIITYCQLTYSTQSTVPIGDTGAANIQTFPSAVVFNNAVWVFYEGSGTTAGQLCCLSGPVDSLNAAGQISFGSSTTIPSPSGVAADTAYMTNAPAAIVFPPPASATAANPSQLYVFYQAAGGTGDILYSVTADGNSWVSSQITYSQDTQVVPARIPTWGWPVALIRDETLFVTLPRRWL
ncbi:hypothetical protein C4K04_2698 [Pseudomonas chlororaphis]|uniref:Uncharacterized protein n=1 Tax=Pseudomonas chlororaphis TaxID=587753 RepID=A0A3G7TMV9_9PSED|nr:hypothetical protein [Pseudomonas chlororaphis]AZE48370.1 hypothetical protein C4K04_2698 [Pseudomonas chlororaphis]